MIAARRTVLATQPHLSSSIADRFTNNHINYKGKIVALYKALESEISLKAVAQQLTAQGIALALPVVTGKNQPLQFRRYRWGDTLKPGVWQIPEPLSDQPEVIPNLLLIPLLAFDAMGNRLGYGGGYYDRTLRQLRAQSSITAIGVALDCQELPQVPTAPHDEKLDAVLTETGWRHFALESPESFAS
jgi:5-formyltetrahydrofolate cyclo-ligase